jgi:hypothetical protein
MGVAAGEIMVRARLDHYLEVGHDVVELPRCLECLGIDNRARRREGSALGYCARYCATAVRCPRTCSVLTCFDGESGIPSVPLAGVSWCRGVTITVLYAEEGLDLADIARHVGHAAPATTAGYVRHLGRRPSATAEAASRLLDPTGFDRDEAGTGVRPRSHD